MNEIFYWSEKYLLNHPQNHRSPLSTIVFRGEDSNEGFESWISRPFRPDQSSQTTVEDIEYDSNTQTSSDSDGSSGLIDTLHVPNGWPADFLVRRTQKPDTQWPVAESMDCMRSRKLSRVRDRASKSRPSSLDRLDREYLQNFRQNGKPVFLLDHYLPNYSPSKQLNRSMFDPEVIKNLGYDFGTLDDILYFRQSLSEVQWP